MGGSQKHRWDASKDLWEIPTSFGESPPNLASRSQNARNRDVRHRTAELPQRSTNIIEEILEQRPEALDLCIAPVRSVALLVRLDLVNNPFSTPSRKTTISPQMLDCWQLRVSVLK